MSAQLADAGQRATVLRLALGTAHGVNWTSVPWPRVLEHATFERCATLAWIRSAALITRFAPPNVSASWRVQALGAGALASLQAGELAELLASLRAVGVAPVVLKGLPLAVMLYGDASARPVFDIDLFVPLAQRAVAHAGLQRRGWGHLVGDPPAEGTYRRRDFARAPHLEVHSSLLDDALLAHLRTPSPESERIDVAGHTMDALSGDLLPVFLAVHLAKHSVVPLLWWIDFCTLWQRLDSIQRQAAQALASRYGLERFLAWAEGGVSLVDQVCSGSERDAQRALASLDALHHRRNAFRVASLVRGTSARNAVILGWLFPPSVRRSFPGLIAATLRRVSARITARERQRGRPVASQSENAPRRAVELAPDAMAAVVREATAVGASVWITARGTSMLPTISRTAEVLVCSIADGGLHRGDVVLVDRARGGLLLHRVVAVRGGILELKGDNRFEVDSPATLGEVLGVARQIRVDGRTVPVPDRPARSLRFSLARMHTYFRRRLSGA